MISFEEIRTSLGGSLSGNAVNFLGDLAARVERLERQLTEMRAAAGSGAGAAPPPPRAIPSPSLPLTPALLTAMGALEAGSHLDAATRAALTPEELAELRLQYRHDMTGLLRAGLLETV